MIHYLNGILSEINPAYAVIDCNGVGYFVNISLNTYTQLQNSENQKVKLLTYFIVKEDAQTLYGFFEEKERNLFKLLLTVSGVGANTARIILSSLNTAEIKNAIISSDATRLQKIKGIGLKTAQRIIVDLHDKVDKDEDFSENISNSHNTIKQESLSALMQLGFARMNVEKVLDKISQGSNNISSVEDMIRLALKYL